ncbi:MAG: TIR domain-containing protein, partial [Anaerolineae bacterium]|nr:TIR domain-containing protein [Anaerolineae bacterium]
MADVFISYSRANIDFARRLAGELRAHNYDLWIDLEGIRFTADWWEEIKRGIETADNFLVVMSPNSLGSPVCHLEIEYARKLKKRILLIDHLPFVKADAARSLLDRLATDAYVNTLLGDRNPMTLFDNNWYVIDKYQRLRFSYDASRSAKFRTGEPETPDEAAAREAEEAAFSQQFTTLRGALNTDLEHAQQHTRYGLRVGTWENSKRNASFLLFGDELSAAETWLRDYDADADRRQREGDAPKLPTPTDEQRAYIAASRAEEDTRTKRLRTLRLARNAAIVVGLIALLITGFATLQSATAFRDADAAGTRAAAADIQVATATAALGTAEQREQQAGTQAAAAQGQATQAAQAAAAVNAQATSVSLDRMNNSALFAANLSQQELRAGSPGNALLLALESVADYPLVYNIESADALQNALAYPAREAAYLHHDGPVNGSVWSADGTRVLTWSSDGSVRVWDAIAGDALLTLRHENGVRGAAFNTDETRILSWSDDGSVRVWDAVAGDALLTLRHESWVNGAAFNTDETSILSWSDDNTVRVWDAVAGGDALLTLRHRHIVSDAEILSDEGRVGCG